MTVLVRPELPAGAAPLSALERRALALAALGHGGSQIAGNLAQEKYRLPADGLGPIWSAAAKKLGTERSRPQGRQPELVFRARVHGVLDLPDPEGTDRLPPDVLGYVQALARGRTLKQYAWDDLHTEVWEVEEIARQARKLLGGATTQANLVYRALPQLLCTVQPPVENARTGLLPAVRSSPIAASLQTDLPSEEIGAVRVGRVWIRGMLPVLGWMGPALQAAEVVARLVSNGVRHGLPDHAKTHTLLLRAAVDEAGNLLVDVADLNPSFPDFKAAVRGERGRGLRQVAQLGAEVSWFLHHEGPGKTVRAVLSLGPVDL
ncbi:ATP-binding protein [Streptomyces misionensis]|uniref:ATP-binding protein n=1 Tax=Streptomyces misionensis TaxID=67331 RepID=UPI0033AEEEAE